MYIIYNISIHGKSQNLKIKVCSKFEKCGSTVKTACSSSKGCKFSLHNSLAEHNCLQLCLQGI